MLCNTNTCQLAAGNCELMYMRCIAKVKLEEVLHKYFSFLVIICDGQLDVLLPVVDGRDMFVWMATGVIFLASLAVSESAVGGAVSPLIGLMEQQVSNLLFCVSHLLATKNG